MKIDLTPSVNIFKTYKNYRYTPSSALGEYFDNSTSSFFENKEAIVDRRIILIVDRRIKGNAKLNIADNAYGMNEENFIRAVRIDDKKKVSERNKFGVGLKVSAIWYSDVWSIETLEYETKDLRKFTFDLDKITQSPNNVFPAEVSKAEFIGEDLGLGFTSGTIVTLNNPRELPTNKHQIKKIYKNISQQFANDIRADNLKFQICEIKNLPNGDIVYIDLISKYIGNEGKVPSKNSIDDLQSVLEEKIVWKKVEGKDFVRDFELSIKDPFDENKIYNITGIVGWVEDSGVGKGGIKRLWKNRALESSLWTEKEIFGLANGIIAQRLYCELDFTDFEVSNSKDTFSIGETLEYELIQALKKSLDGIKKEIREISQKETDERNRLKLEKEVAENEKALSANQQSSYQNEKAIISNKIIDVEELAELYLEVGGKTVGIKTTISEDFLDNDQLIKNQLEDDENLEYHFSINKNHPLIANASENNINNIIKLIYLVCRTDMESKVSHVLHMDSDWFSSVKLINELLTKDFGSEDIDKLIKGDKDEI